MQNDRRGTKKDEEEKQISHSYKKYIRLRKNVKIFLCAKLFVSPSPIIVEAGKSFKK